MVSFWINGDGSTTPISSPQDVAKALESDPETAELFGEELAKEIENEQ